MFFYQADKTDLFQKDYTLVKAAVPVLQEYLLSEALYWMIPFQGKQISLTPGQLLLAAKRLPVEANDTGEKEAVLQTVKDWQHVRQQWLSAWQRKAKREWDERTHRLAVTLSESEPSLSPVTLNQVVCERCLIALLTHDVHNDLSLAETTLLQRQDQLLRAKSKAGAFTWADQLKDEFPEADFWFLYRQPVTGKK